MDLGLKQLGVHEFGCSNVLPKLLLFFPVARVTGDNENVFAVMQMAQQRAEKLNRAFGNQDHDADRKRLRSLLFLKQLT